MMNAPKKIVNTYFRLNGFFLLPQFTYFLGGQYNHVDLMALRPPSGKEVVRDITFPIDVDFFNCLSEWTMFPTENFLGAVVEIKGNQEREIPLQSHMDYATEFFGNAGPIIPVSVSLSYKKIDVQDHVLRIPLQHALSWSLYRIYWVESHLDYLKKVTSWSWSEEFLSDLLYLQNINFSDLDRKAREQLKAEEENEHAS
jgi:hypothetical protein